MAFVYPRSARSPRSGRSEAADSSRAMNVDDLEPAPIPLPGVEQWTPAMVGTMIALGAFHDIDTDEDGVSYPAWNWGCTGPGYTVTLMAFREPNDGLWVYVAELWRDDGQDTSAPLLKPTVTSHDRDLMLKQVADLLNYARSLPSPT